MADTVSFDEFWALQKSLKNAEAKVRRRNGDIDEQLLPRSATV